MDSHQHSLWRTRDDDVRVCEEEEEEEEEEEMEEEMEEEEEEV